MPSASLRNRLRALEAAQTLASDDAYWEWVRNNVDTLNSGLIIENFNNPPAKVSRHASNSDDETPQRRPSDSRIERPEQPVEQPTPAPPTRPARDSQPAPGHPTQAVLIIGS